MKWIAAVLTLVLGVACPATTRSAESPPPFWLEWGATGSGDGEFLIPYGIAAHQSVVYVSDTQNHRIQKFTAGGQFLAKWGSFGSGDGQFQFSGGIDVDASGTVFVTEEGTGPSRRIQKFSPEGAFLGGWPYAGRGSIAVDPTGQFVYAPEGRLVYKYTREGVLLAQWTLSTNARDSDHWAIAVGSGGNVYVVDRGEHVVRKLTPDGTLLLTWGTRGPNPGQFEIPEGIAIDDLERVYIADAGNARVQKFTDTGGFLVAWGTGGIGPGQFSVFRDLAVDSDGNVYCLDGNRVEKFGDSDTPAQNVTWGRIKALYR